MWILAVIGGLVVLVALYVACRGRYYTRLFSARSFREFHRGLSRAIEAAQRKAPDQPPSRDDGTAFVTDSGLAVAVTSSKGDDGNQALHISLSQPGQVTTHALCSRFGFFAVAMFEDVKGELTPYYTDSGVHHLVFRLQTPTVHLQNFDLCFARYLSNYKPVPFRHEKLESEQSAAPNVGSANAPPASVS